MDDVGATNLPSAPDRAVRRRWFQISMKGLLSALTLIGLLLTWMGHNRGWWRQWQPLAVAAIREAARLAYDEVSEHYSNGRATLDEVCLWSQRLMEAEQAAAETKDETVEAVAGH